MFKGSKSPKTAPVGKSQPKRERPKMLSDFVIRQNTPIVVILFDKQQKDPKAVRVFNCNTAVELNINMKNLLKVKSLLQGYTHGAYTLLKCD